jgi:hypothetical protein
MGRMLALGLLSAAVLHGCATSPALRELRRCVEELKRYSESAGDGTTRVRSCSAERAECVRQHGEDECSKILRRTVIDMDDVANGPEDALSISDPDGGP